MRTAEVVIPGTVDDFGTPAVSSHTPGPGSDLGDLEFGDPNLTEEEPAQLGQAAIPEGSQTQILANPLPGLDLTGPTPGLSHEAGWEQAAAVVGPRWPVVLLASYASVITLICAFMLWGVRTGRGGVSPPGTILADSRPDLGRRAGRSQTITPPAPLPTDRLTMLGRPIRVGSLEVTPLGVEAGPVALEREPIGGPRQVRPGGEDALRLRVRLRNLSRDAIYEPLDEAFLREPDRGLPASYLTSSGDDRIYMYPLAVESEWSIVGQTFPRLRPGESAEAVIVTAPRALGRAAGPMTWRLRLRSGPDRIDEVGVRFDSGQIGRSGDQA